ncbi:MAG TPA: hypothetical protein PKG52_03610 [bacterium]|nr:hypothetical protein [bacterium]HPS29128.1 hypothetical protein [bacterium]
MEKNYQKPEIIQETALERKLVYAEAVDERNGCSTLGMNIPSDKTEKPA